MDHARHFRLLVHVRAAINRLRLMRARTGAVPIPPSTTRDTSDMHSPGTAIAARTHHPAAGRALGLIDSQGAVHRADADCFQVRDAIIDSILLG